MSAANCLDSLVYASSLNKSDELSPQGSSLKTPLPALNHFFQGMEFHGLVEWGVPMGSISRLLPAMVARALKKECLWISDQDTAHVYPKSWSGLGFDLNNIYFLNEQSPLMSIRTLLQENTFSFLIIDSQQKLKTSDLHFLSQCCRKNDLCVFLFRSYFLSSKNGNPFCRYRINSSYSIDTKRFQLTLIKGAQRQKALSLSFSEVLCG